MGMIFIEEEKIASYKLKNDAQIWYEQWRYSRLVGLGPIEWEMLEWSFLDRFFKREFREAKLEEFVNLKQCKMIVKEISFNINILSEYYPSIVSNQRYNMNWFLRRVSDMVEKESHMSMPIDNIGISSLMIYSKKMED